MIYFTWVICVTNKKGFTLVELMAVIVILAILMTLGGVSVFKVVEDSKSELLKDQINSLKDTAITALEKKYFEICPSNFDEQNPDITQKNKCYREISVEELVANKAFENKNDLCKTKENKKIIVYRKNEGNFSELRSYVPENTCSY